MPENADGHAGSPAGVAPARRARSAAWLRGLAVRLERRSALARVAMVLAAAGALWSAKAALFLA